MDRAAKVSPLSLLELTVQHSIVSLLSKPQWWRKWKANPATQSKWLDEIQHELLHKTFTQSLKWSSYELQTLRGLERILRMPPSPERDALGAEWTAFVRFEHDYRARGHAAAENDDEEEEEEDYEKKKNAYVSILWYFTYAALREKLSAVPVQLWTMETMQPAIQAAEERSDPSVLPRAVGLVRSLWVSGASDEHVQNALGDIESRPDVIALVRSQCESILAELRRVRSYITQVVDQLADSDDLHVDIAGSDDRVSVSPTGIHGAWISDNLISDAVKSKFVHEVSALENVPDEQKDWHPNTDKQVLDLIHPSLYCCVLGKTKQIAAPLQSEAATCDDPAEQMDKIMFGASNEVVNAYRGKYGSASNFQWIPSDFQVREDGTVRVLSYINNLHPKHFASMYTSIESIFGRFVPLFDRVLSALSREYPDAAFGVPEDYNRDRPTVPENVLPPTDSTSMSVTLKGKTVQVIVKVAEILLTPESPKYEGGSWHIEGTETEQIVATGIYYFGSENIKDSRLSFRVNVEEPMYEQSDDSGVAVMYGLFNEDLLVQTLGSVSTIEDRCLAFPNILQHKVEPFALDDPTKPGARKILAFFLIDPEKQIPSTSVIPPQQQHWIDEIQGPLLKKLKLFEFAEQRVKEMASSDSMTLDQAQAYRLELMNERSALSEPDPDDYESYFSLCEH